MMRRKLSLILKAGCVLVNLKDKVEDYTKEQYDDIILKYGEATSQTQYLQ